MGVKIKSIAMFLVVLLPLAMIGMIAVMDNTNHSTPTPEEEDVLYLTCTVGSNVKLTFEGKEYKTGDVLILTDDANLTLDSLTGRVYLNYSYQYTDETGMSSDGQMSLLGTTMTVDVTFICTGKGTGELKVWSESE